MDQRFGGLAIVGAWYGSTELVHLGADHDPVWVIFSVDERSSTTQRTRVIGNPLGQRCLLALLTAR